MEEGKENEKEGEESGGGEHGNMEGQATESLQVHYEVGLSNYIIYSTGNETCGEGGG